MSVFSKHSLYFFLCLLLLSCTLGGEGKQELKPPMDSVQNEYIFSLSEPLSEIEIRQVFAKFTVAELTEINQRNHSYKIKFSKDPGIEVLNETIRQSGKFRFIEKNSIFKKS